MFLPRHGRGHRLSPSGINYRANIDALEARRRHRHRVGVGLRLVQGGAVPGTFVLIDQFVDRTFSRESSFFGNGCVAHVSMAHPVAPRLQARIAPRREAEGIPCLTAGPMSAWKGRNSPRWPRAAPTRRLGFDVIGMTAMPEAKLAREAEICLRHGGDGDRLRLLAPRPRRTSTSPR